MTIYSPEDSQIIRERSLRDVATAKPTGFVENFSAAWDEFRNNDRYGALREQKRAAWQKRIAKVKELTGEDIADPFTATPELFRAGRDRIDPDQLDADQRKWFDALPEVRDPIGMVYSLFENDNGLTEPQRLREHERRIEEIRRGLPDGMQKLIPTAEDIERELAGRAGELERRSADIGARATAGGTFGRIAGGGVAATIQPEVLVTLPLGAPVRAGLLARILTEAGVAALSEASLQPGVQAQREALGLDSGMAQAVENIGGAALGAGGLTAGIGLAGRAFMMVARGGADAFEKVTGRAPSADERALIDAVQRDMDLERATPYEDRTPVEFADDLQNRMTGEEIARRADETERELLAAANFPQEIPASRISVQNNENPKPSLAAQLDGVRFTTDDPATARLLEIGARLENGTATQADAQELAKLWPLFDGLASYEAGFRQIVPQNLQDFTRFTRRFWRDVREQAGDSDALHVAAPIIDPEAVSEYRLRLYMASDMTQGVTRRPITDFDGENGIVILRNDDLKNVDVDADLMQFKSGADSQGVTERLRGVKRWEVERAGVSMIYQFEDGRQIIADGHQRLALARRLAAEGQDIEMPAIVMREADGVTPQEARARAAFKNIAEGTGSSQDAAKVLRDLGATADDLNLPPRSALVRDAEGLMRLDDETFGMVVNDVISEQFGAIIGRLVDDPRLHPAIAKLLAKVRPANAIEAESIVRQAQAAGVTRETQTSLFGDKEVAESLFLERARVLDRSLKMIRRNVDTFRTLSERATDIEGEGNVLNAAANADRLDVENALRTFITAQAHRKGTIGDALTKAAREAKDTGQYAEPARSFVRAVTRAIEDGEVDGAALSRRGADPQSVDPVGARAAADKGEGHPQQIDDADLAKFDDPVSKATDEQALGIERELKDAMPEVQSDIMDLPVAVGERIDDAGNRVADTRTVQDVLDDLEADQEFVEQLKLCDGGGVVA